MGGVSRGPFIMATKRASYTVTFKLKVFEDRAAAMEYRVKEKQVRDWRQEKDTLMISALEITLFFSQKRGASYNPGNTVYSRDLIATSKTGTMVKTYNLHKNHYRHTLYMV